LTHHQKKLKLGKPPKIIVLCEEGIPPLYPTYLGERRTTFAKTYGVKVRCYWELFGEHVGNLRIFFFDSHHPKKNLHGKSTIQVEMNNG
jgi:hypothetical protein